MTGSLKFTHERISGATRSTARRFRGSTSYIWVEFPSRLSYVEHPPITPDDGRFMEFMILAYIGKRKVQVLDSVHPHKRDWPEFSCDDVVSHSLIVQRIITGAHRLLY